MERASAAPESQSGRGSNIDEGNARILPQPRDEFEPIADAYVTGALIPRSTRPLRRSTVDDLAARLERRPTNRTRRFCRRRLGGCGAPLIDDEVNFCSYCATWGRIGKQHELIRRSMGQHA